jgi:hypothetical protein
MALESSHYRSTKPRTVKGVAKKPAPNRARRVGFRLPFAAGRSRHPPIVPGFYFRKGGQCPHARDMNSHRPISIRRQRPSRNGHEAIS